MIWALLIACTSRETAPPRGELPSHTVGFGGDVILGRRLNEALHTPQRSAIFEDVKPWMQGVDVMLLNAEGVISGGGRFFDKGESRPIMYRAHPVAMDVLADAGVDVLALGNNHSLDYGPQALVEMIDRAHAAGIEVAGGGEDAAHAATPAYVTAGDVVIAFVGADLTPTRMYAATTDRAGTRWLPGHLPRKADEVADALLVTLKEARQHAHVVFFTPHWGNNYVPEPTAQARKIARRLLEGGYDGVLGHSAHIPQGIELVDGKPVIYDAGNFLNDYNTPPRHRTNFFYELEIDRAGVREVRARPVQVLKNRTVPATGEPATKGLKTLVERSAALGTTVQVDGEEARVTCRPSPVHAPSSPPPPPLRPATVREAPGYLVVPALPEGVTRDDVRWANGVRLVGHDLLLDKLRKPKGSNLVTLWFTIDEPVDDGAVEVYLDARPAAARGRHEPMAHLPGDWLLPVDQWTPGTLVRDQTLHRLTLRPEGVVDFSVSLRRGDEPVPIVQTSLPRAGEGVALGSATYADGQDRIFAHLPPEPPP